VTSDDLASIEPGSDAPDAPGLEMRGIYKSFASVEALRGVDLEVRPAEVMALVGDNGAGKSTLIKVLSGVHVPDAGTIAVDGTAVHFGGPKDAVRAGIETVYQDLALCDNLDVVANLYLGRELRSPTRGVAARFLAVKRMSFEARRILEELAVTIPSLATPVSSLSGGQRQAIAVGRAVLWGSRIVVLDEPTAALGVQQTATVYELVGTLRDRGISVVLISHNMVDVFAIADRVTVLRLGTNAGVFDTAAARPQDVIAAITGSDAVVAGGRR
jgi:D-xylose transport system ATP-binding protein